MDGTQLIDDLKVSPNSRRSMRFMRENEFFECDFCGTICHMPMAQYKTYSEQEILKSKFRCARCAKQMSRPSKYENVTKEKILELREQGLNNRAIARHFQMSEANLYDIMKKVGLSKPKEKKEAPKVLEPKVDKPNQSTDISNMVDKPPHYTAGGIECIDAIMAAVMGLTPQEAVCVANVIKYTWRFKKKNGKQDLHKAEWYLKRLVQLQGE